MKRNRIIAMLLGTALLVCGCQQTPKATDEEKKIEAEKNTTKTEEKEYQGKLDLISPAAYNNTNGLKLKKGDYISIIGKANGTHRKTPSCFAFANSMDGVFGLYTGIWQETPWAGRGWVRYTSS